MIEIPLSDSPEQNFSIILNEIKYDIRVLLNSRTSTWSLDLSSNGLEIVSGVNLVSGVDIFSQHNIGIENAYIVNLDNPRLDPSEEGLGGSSKLFILTEEEVNVDSV